MSDGPVTLTADDRATRFWLAAAAAFLIVQIVTLALMGRIPICECGYVRLFEPGVNTAGNSQHISDWYTPSHIIHGFLFYWLAIVALPRAAFGARLTLAVVVEAAWELLENSPIIIDRYRTATMAIGYQGDSILNSAMDTVAMVLGMRPCEGLFDRRIKTGLERLRIEGADLLVEDRAVARYEIAFRNAVDAPVDGRLAVRIDADRSIGIAEFAKEPQRVVVLVLVVDADDSEPRILGQFLEDRVLLPARHAPGGEDIDEGQLAGDRLGGEGRRVRTVEPGHGKSRRLRANQCRGQVGDVLAVDLLVVEHLARRPGKDGENRQGDDGHEITAYAAAGALL